MGELLGTGPGPCRVIGYIILDTIDSIVVVAVIIVIVIITIIMIVVVVSSIASGAQGLGLRGSGVVFPVSRRSHFSWQSTWPKALIKPQRAEPYL